MGGHGASLLERRTGCALRRWVSLRSTTLKGVKALRLKCGLDCKYSIPKSTQKRTAEASLSLANQLVHLTTRIETFGAQGRGSGTGFFHNFNEDGETSIPCIVTNKHVVDGYATATIAISTKDEDHRVRFGQHRFVQIPDLAAAAIFHPDPDVDLACIPIGNVLHQMAKNGEPAFFKATNKALIAREKELSELTAIESVVMIGYPNGLWDSNNNLPVVRTGVTASPVFVDFQGKAQFAIDCACFGGSSGSPVFLYNEGSYATANGLNLGSRLMLLGILYAGAIYAANGELEIEPIGRQNRVVSRTMLPINLGYCIKASKLDAFEAVLDNRLKSLDPAPAASSAHPST